MALPHSGIPAADPAPQDATVDDLTAATLTVTGASTLATVTATSVSAPHSGLTGVTADQHHAQSHGHTGADGSGTVAHSATTGLTANDHHNQAHVIDGADHTASGLTAGHVLRATGATTFAFGSLADADVPATIARDTEVATAVSDHVALADPHTGYQKESEKAVASGYASLDASGFVPNAQLARGTSFPVSPATNDRFFRTDRGLEYFYDGTRWLTTYLYCQPFAGQRALLPVSAAASVNAPVWTDDYDQYVVDLRISVHIVTTNDGSNYWSLRMDKIDGGTNTMIVTVTSSALGPNVWARLRVSVNALLGTVTDALDITASKVGTPGNLYFVPMVTYRLVG